MGALLKRGTVEGRTAELLYWLDLIRSRETPDALNQPFEAGIAAYGIDSRIDSKPEDPFRPLIHGLRQTS
jgi:hypothetical protein